MKARAVAVLALCALASAGAPAQAKWASAASGTGTVMSTTIAAPGTLSGSCSLLTGKVTLNWVATPTPWADGYSVEWGTASHTYTSVATTTSLTFTTPALGLGTFYFGVRATKGAWRSAYTNEVSKTFLLVQCL